MMKKLIKEVLPPRMFFFVRQKLKKHFDEILIINDFLDYKDGVMFDVGSLNGFSFMPFLLKNWKVFAFEPDENNYQGISKYLKKWNLKASLHKNAVSNIKETRTFYTSTSSKGIPSLLKFNNSQVPSYEVDTITLKDFVIDNDISAIDFLKIDVEGYDLMVLEGFDFSKFKPRVIMCEFEDKKTVLLDYTVKDMGNFLIEQGYFLVYSIWHPIKEYGIQHDWKKLSTDISEIETDDWGNIIAFATKTDFDEFKRQHNF